VAPARRIPPLFLTLIPILALIGTPAPSLQAQANAGTRAAIEAQYEKMRMAYFNHTPDSVLAVQDREYTADLPDGRHWTADSAAAYFRASFEQVQRTITLSFTIDSLHITGDTAEVWIYQHWVRDQLKGGQLRRVDTEARQRETWVRRPDGWHRLRVDQVRPGVWLVDGERVNG
jgi:hypothetical protein